MRMIDPREEDLDSVIFLRRRHKISEVSEAW